MWDFVSSMDNWAPLVPGYISHDIVNKKVSKWKFYTDIGLLKKKVHLKVNITSWIEPSKVTFDLTGLNEKFTGDGYFLAKVINDNETEIKGYLNIIAEGPLAKMMNSILQTTIPEMTSELTSAVALKIEELGCG